MNPSAEAAGVSWHNGEQTGSVLRFRDVRQHDGCPASDRPGSGAIGVGSVPAPDALKDRLRWSVGLRDMPALGALQARVWRIDKQDADSGSFRLVLKK